jgi:branched-subunit amino acid aminotransferase/4-amino-4-deoxychorismate lyase
MRAITSRIPRNERSPLTKFKTLSCLDNVLARREAHGCGKDEALLLNTSGHLACASAANLFLVFGKTLITPSTASGALRGIMRELVLTEIALRTGLAVTERTVGPEELAAADEAFLTSALLGIMPLTAVDGSLIGEGVPGPVSSALGMALENLWCERFDNESGQVTRQGGPGVEQIRER